MSKRTLIGLAAAIALAVGGVLYLRSADGDNVPPVMTRQGESNDGGIIVRRRAIDYETIIKSSLTEQASLITLTLAGEVIRNQALETSIRFTPFPASHAQVRVRYRVEYAFGFPLKPNDFAVAQKGEEVVVTVRRPRLVARPSVRLLSYQVLESGLLVDEKTAIIELQQRLQPEAERRGRMLVQRPNVSAHSEQVLRRFLQGILDKSAAAGGTTPPRVTIRYH